MNIKNYFLNSALVALGVCTFCATSADKPKSNPKSINGLLLWYPFCENTNDASGNGRHAISGGDVYTTDRFGTPNRAYRPGEQASEVKSPFQFDDPSAHRTFSIWFMTDMWRDGDNPGYYGSYAGKGKRDLIYGVNAALSIWDNGTAGLDGPYRNAVFTGTPLAAKKWHHVCLAYSGQMDTIKVWVNGKALTQVEGGSIPIKNTPSNVVVPGEKNVSYDELRVYDYAFSEADAIRLFNEQRPAGNAGCGTSNTNTGGGHNGNAIGQPFRIPGITPGVSAPPVYFRTNLTPFTRAILLPNDPRKRRLVVRGEGKGQTKEPTEPIIPSEPAVTPGPVNAPGNLPEGRP